MPSSAPQPQATELDPTGTVIYYLCVKHANASATYKVPSTQFISDLLRVTKTSDGETVPVDQEVRSIWEDLWWMNEHKLLFGEELIEKTMFFRPLSQHNVNRRMHEFHGFVQPTEKQRHINPKDIVERPASAARLVALKDLYHFTGRQLPQQMYYDFCVAERLITNAQEYSIFLHSMNRIRYVDIDPTDALSSIDISSGYFFLEPSQLFRFQDMYVELLALDYLKVSGPSQGERRVRRLDLRESARKYVEQHAPSLS